MIRHRLPYPRRGAMTSGRALCSMVLLLAACIDVAAERLPIRAFTTADGLPDNDIHRIVKDSRGFLWFCTADGLSRFDGYTFINFGTEQGLPDASVNTVLETRHGEYWVATQDGLARFDPKGTPRSHAALSYEATATRPMFTVVVPDDKDRRARAIGALLEGRDGTIWVGTEKGLYRLDRSHGQESLRPVEIHLPDTYPEGRFIQALLEDPAGSLWIATPNGLYRRTPDGHATRYTKRDGLPDEYVHDLLQDHEGRLWAATRYGGFFRFTADNTDAPPRVDLTLSVRDGLPATWVFQLFETSAHRFWVATAQGLAEFFPDAAERGRRLRTYDRSSGLTYHDITALGEDLGGNLWLGTNTAGAMKLTRDGFTTYGEQDGIEIVSAVFEDRAGEVCFRASVQADARSAFEAKQDTLGSPQATYHTRLGCFDGRRFDWFMPTVVGNIGWVPQRSTLQARSGDWWVGTGEGLYRFPAADRLAQIKTARPLAVYTMKDGLPVLQVFRLFEDSGGNVWISTTSSNSVGLARWDHDSGTVRNLSHSSWLSSLNDDRPRAFAEDRSGHVWIGFSSAVARYQQGRFTFFSAKDGLPPGAIEDLHVDHAGRLWFASARGGLGRVDDPGVEHPSFRTYTTEEGLSSNSTSVITEDRRGNIYVGGGRGLDRLDPATGRIKHFTMADGLPPGVFHAAFRDHTGVLWFGMSSGLARLAPAPDTPPVAPPVLISGLRIRGLPQAVSAFGEQELSLPDLTALQNQLQIDFVGLSFESGDVLHYQYRLEGADTEWTAPGEQRSVTYASLSPGRYVFNVRAVNSDGLVSPHPATMAFTILRPLWQRSWFLGLAGVALGLMGYGVYQYRVARLLQIAELRTRIATDLHDDIGANLTRIALLSEVTAPADVDLRYAANRLAGVVVDAGVETAPLASIGRIARESVGSMNDIVWAINPARETLLDLTRRMRQHANEVFTLRDIELQFSAPPGGEHVKLGVDVRRDVLLIYKEAVNNAARHSRCSRVEIDFRVERSRLRLVVADNGSGFDPSLESEGQGLRSMTRRALRLRGTLETDSAAGAGTTVRLSIPL